MKKVKSLSLEEHVENGFRYCLLKEILMQLWCNSEKKYSSRLKTIINKVNKMCSDEEKEHVNLYLERAERFIDENK